MRNKHLGVAKIFPWQRPAVPSVKVSAARNTFELVALDQKREALRRKLEALSEVSFKRRLEAEMEKLPNPVDEQDELLMEYYDVFRALEERRDSIVTRKPESRRELERWYSGKAGDFRRLGDEVSLLTARVEDLSFRYYGVQA
ncbi:MAG: hypothetical protein HGA31_03260 [Candidatus Moranbacteria bacterium]|nr:hypothetical protein [Candidatus Moranbacteria bacterium]